MSNKDQNAIDRLFNKDEVERLADKLTAVLNGENTCSVMAALHRLYTWTFALHCYKHGRNIERELDRELPTLAVEIKFLSQTMADHVAEHAADHIDHKLH
jgi:hypothetical protein